MLEKHGAYLIGHFLKAFLFLNRVEYFISLVKTFNSNYTLTKIFLGINYQDLN